ncbi:hypothetical protein [Sinorhizobium psoraleae]|uniref:Uncharacterized protein n=1 Tax=Sinorhizobium psoraleae TaxID=520838 RepID=A0ABT4KND7_9HYPH|nr:hypothetical protein [Sinorhizobium psoraleae]MCZ4093453.1 hypothetical protein [Sinorhizobium psoraleae]
MRLPEASKDAAVRKWLSECVDHLTWLDEVVRFKRQFRALTRGVAGADPGHLASTWMNLALSYPALARLSSDATEFDSVFQGGMAGAVGRLGDPADPSRRGHISQWKFGASGMIPDILLIIAADRDDDLRNRLERERADWSAAGLLEIHIDQGRDLSRTGTPGSFPSGLEHFGFKDGVSQPAVRGRLSDADDDYLNPRDGVERPGTTIEYASPGSPLICPGSSYWAIRNKVTPWARGF